MGTLFTITLTFCRALFLFWQTLSTVNRTVTLEFSSFIVTSVLLYSPAKRKRSPYWWNTEKLPSKKNNEINYNKKVTVEIIIIMHIFGIALSFIRNELSALYTFTHDLMMMIMYTYKKLRKPNDC